MSAANAFMHSVIREYQGAVDGREWHDQPFQEVVGVRSLIY